jgi:hypothetical protein
MLWFFSHQPQRTCNFVALFHARRQVHNLDTVIHWLSTRLLAMVEPFQNLQLMVRCLLISSLDPRHVVSFISSVLDLCVASWPLVSEVHRVHSWLESPLFVQIILLAAFTHGRAVSESRLFLVRLTLRCLLISSLDPRLVVSLMSSVLYLCVALWPSVPEV